MFYGSKGTSEEGRASQVSGTNAPEAAEFPDVKKKVSVVLDTLCLHEIW